MKMFLGLLGGLAAAVFTTPPANADGLAYARTSVYRGGSYYGHPWGGLGHHRYRPHWGRGFGRSSFGLSIGLPYRGLRLGYGGYGPFGYGGSYFGLSISSFSPYFSYPYSSYYPVSSFGLGGYYPYHSRFAYSAYSPYSYPYYSSLGSYSAYAYPSYLSDLYPGYAYGSYSAAGYPYVSGLYSTPAYSSSTLYGGYSDCLSAPALSFVPEVMGDCCWPTEAATVVSPATPVPSTEEPSASADGLDYDFDRAVEIDAAEPEPAIVPTTLQVHTQSAKGYPIVAGSGWVGSALSLIDSMAEQDGLLAAEAACRQMIAVRDNLPAGVHLRAGLLGLMNGRTPQEVARDFRAAASEGVRIGRNSVSPRFARALQLNDPATLEPFIQQAAKDLLAGDAGAIAAERLVSVDAAVATPAADSVQSLSASSDTRMILDTLLRVSGQRAKADAIAAALADR